MKREWTNVLRTVVEDWLPPAVRDSQLFAWVMSLVFGKLVYALADFRRRAHALGPEEYDAIYRRLNDVRAHGETDNSVEILEAIATNVPVGTLVDIGCGTGYTLGWLKRQLPDKVSELTGVDFQIAPDMRARFPDITFLEHDITQLPFEDGAFDTVICTHTLEHILDIHAAIAELRRICGRRLILAVPREREGRYALNAHFHFFPYVESFLRAMVPLPARYTCRAIGRDIFYVEEKA